MTYQKETMPKNWDNPTNEDDCKKENRLRKNEDNRKN